MVVNRGLLKRLRKAHAKIRTGYKDKERQRDARGRWWIAPRLAAARTGYCKETLNLWSTEKGGGCPLLGGRTLIRKPFVDGNGRTNLFYSERQIDELTEAFHRIPVNPPMKGHVSLLEAKQKHNVALETQHRLHDNKRLTIVRQMGRDSDGKVRNYHRVLVADLDSYKENRKNPAHPENKINSFDAAALLGLQYAAFRRLALRKGWKPAPGMDRAGREGRAVYYDRDVIEEEKKLRDGQAKNDKPLEWGGFTWSTVGGFCKRAGFKSWHTAERYRSASLHCLDGRESRQEVPPASGRPVLAICAPYGGPQWEEVWVYNDADGQLIEARRKGRISAGEARRQADEILAKCQKALKKSQSLVICNFADLRRATRTGEAGGSMYAAHANRRTDSNGGQEQEPREPLPQVPYPVVIVNTLDQPIPIRSVSVTEPNNNGSLKEPIEWSEPKSPTEWAGIFDVHYNTMIEWLRSQKIRNQQVSPRRYRVATEEIPLPPRE